MMTDVSHRMEVRRIDLAFEEDPSRFKGRPVIVAISDHGTGNSLVIKVTGHGPRREFPGEIRLDDWKLAGLDKPSTARCSKALLLPTSYVERGRLYGYLSPADAGRVLRALRDLDLI